MQIGTGLTGTSAVYHLTRELFAERGESVSVAVFEARDFCAHSLSFHTVHCKI